MDKFKYTLIIYIYIHWNDHILVITLALGTFNCWGTLGLLDAILYFWKSFLLITHPDVISSVSSVDSHLKTWTTLLHLFYSCCLLADLVATQTLGLTTLMWMHQGNSSNATSQCFSAMPLRAALKVKMFSESSSWQETTCHLWINLQRGRAIGGGGRIYGKNWTSTWYLP